MKSNRGPYYITGDLTTMHIVNLTDVVIRILLLNFEFGAAHHQQIKAVKVVVQVLSD